MGTIEAASLPENDKLFRREADDFKEIVSPISNVSA